MEEFIHSYGLNATNEDTQKKNSFSSFPQHR